MGDMMGSEYEGICKVLEIIVDRLEALEKEAAETSRLVTEEIIGGIKSVYDRNARMMKISDLRTKHADFPYAGDFQDMYSADLFDKLADVEGGEEKIAEILDAIRAKFDKIKGVQKAVSVEVTPAEGEAVPVAEEPAAVEEEVSAEEPESDEIDSLIRDMTKDKSGLQPGTMRE